MDLNRTNWIWTPDWTDADDRSARVVLFRKIFKIGADAVPCSALIRVSADSRYKFFVNGEFVAEGPCKGDRCVRYYDEVDIAPWLHTGSNTVAVEVLRYPEEERGRNLSLFRAKIPGLMVSGWLDADETWRCITDRSKSFVREEDRFAPLIIHEKVTADVALHKWKEAEFDDSGWYQADAYSEDEIPDELKTLAARPIPLEAHEKHSFRCVDPENEVLSSEKTLVNWKGLITGDKAIPADSRVSAVLDAGEEMCGYIRMELEGGKGSQIELLYAECYQIPEGNRLVKRNRLDSENGILEGYSDTYIAHGKGDSIHPEVYEPFWFRTFRFIKVTIKTGEEPLKLTNIGYTETGYPLEVNTRVNTSDESLAGIWDISLRTLRRCMHETYMDCPYYEQLQYIMDTRSEALYTYAISADDRMARKAIYEFGRSQYSDGLLNCSYPSINRNIIPGFSIYYIMMVHDHMMYFGDRQLVRDQWPVIERILGFFGNHIDEHGLVDKIGGGVLDPIWSFIDWADEWMPDGMPLAGRHGSITMESLLYILSLDAAAELVEYIADNEQLCDGTIRDSVDSSADCRDAAIRYRKTADSIRYAILQYCMNEEGFITDGPGRQELSQHCQVFGILAGVLGAEEGRRALRASMNDNRFAKCTVSMRFYLFRALEMTGLYELTDSCWDVWRRMIADGCTTSIESDAYTRSECHAWGSLALFELPSVTLGVRPAAPGYSKIKVDPVPGYMKSASGTVHTPKGDINVSWVNDSDEFKLSINAEDSVMSLITSNER